MKKRFFISVLFLIPLFVFSQEVKTPSQNVKVISGSITATVSGVSTASNQLKQITRGVNDSTQIAALKISIDSTKRFIRATMGLQGGDYMSGVVNKTATPNGFCISVLEAATVDSIKWNGEWITSWTGAAGQTLYGKIDTVANTSGKIIIYYW